MYENVNINLAQLEKDYGAGAMDDYIRRIDRTTITYIKNPYKEFMKTIIGLDEYKVELSKNLGKYGTYLLTMQDFAREDNSIDMMLFSEKNKFSDNQFNRIVACYKKYNVLKKKGYTFYLNPLVMHYGANINLELAAMFENELNDVGFNIKKCKM